MLQIRQITIDSQTDPVGVSGAPLFCWILDSGRTNVLQESYRLQVARDAMFRDVAYDSGAVLSGESVHVAADGLELASSTKYYARIRASDGTEESDWSKTASFTTALLSDGLWQGIFISAETEADAGNSKGTCLRRGFRAKPGIASAVVHVTALGLYNLYINGQRVTDDELTPGWTSYHKRLLYQTYDVSNLIHGGENAIGAILGAGWYKGLIGFDGLRNLYGTRTALLCQLEIFYEDGGKDVISTGKAWKGEDAPVLFSEIYDGETYDARLEAKGWASPGFDDGGWRGVSEVPFDKRLLVAQSGGKVKPAERFAARSLIVTPRGDTVLDFGQNLAGWVEFKAKGKAGDRVVLRHFEVLDQDGNVYLDNLRSAKQAVVYTLGGGEEESFHPHFTYHGFRYVKVEEYPGEVKPENFTAVALYSEMRQTGRFECSNAVVNQLHHNIGWGLRSNFVDIPTDCPQRNERLGWTGDAQIFCRTATYLMDTSLFFGKWLGDVSADQTGEGGVPHVVPDIVTGRSDKNWLLSQGTHSAAAWSDAAVIIPWTLYLMRGDKRVLLRQYDGMKAWVDFMRRHSDGAKWSYRLQFGDWVALDAAEGSYFGATPNDLVCSAYYAYSTGILAKAAAALGNTKDAEEYGALYDSIREGFRREYFTAGGELTARTQTAHILALHFGLVPDRFKPGIVNTLLKLLAEQDGHLVTGFVGTPYFCHALSANGCTDEAYALLLKDDFPSWLYQVKAGATTVWEHWDGIKPDGSMWSADMNSFNHYAYGAIGEWLYRAVAGIDTDEGRPGFRHSVLHPRIGKGLEWARAGYASQYGGLRVEWRREGSGIALDVTIPHNTTATIVLDRAVRVSEASGLSFGKAEGGMAAEAGSGAYHIEFDMRE